MSAPLDVSVTRFMNAPPERVRGVMFDPTGDPRWMKAVKSVEPLDEGRATGARVRRTGRFLGRPLRWTTELVSITPSRLDLRIVDGPMRGTVTYEIQPAAGGSEVSIRNVGSAPGFAPRRLLMWAMRRSLAADLARLQRVVEEAR
jgi:uncharacterized membrane protein